MAARSSGGNVLNRLVLAMTGGLIALFGLGILVIATRDPLRLTIGTFIAAVICVTMTMMGLRHMYLASCGRIPRWFAEFMVFAGGVFVGGSASSEHDE